MKEEIKFAVAFILMIVLSANAQKATEKKSLPLVDPTTNCQLRYYYFPNLEAYYDTKENIYYYSEGGEWTTAEELPSGYRGYSLNNKINVIITDYDDDNPIQFLPLHKKKYPYNNGKNRRLMASIH